MKIVAPIDGRDRFDELIRSEAEEFFCGFLPAMHVKEYSPLYSLNRRSFIHCSFDDLDVLFSVAGQVAGQGKRLFVAFNSPFYMTAEYPAILEFVRGMAREGVAGFILSDVGLMAFLRDNGVAATFVAGVDTGVQNPGAARFLRAAGGVSRIILDRCLSLQEVAAVVRGAPGLEWEVIVTRSYCKNVDGFCRHIHGLNASSEVDDFENREIPCWKPHEVRTIAAADPGRAEELRAWLEHASHLAYGGCAACALPALDAAGVTHLKVAARGHPTDVKLADIRFVSRCLELARDGLDADDYFARVRRLRAALFGAACAPQECYYYEP